MVKKFLPKLFIGLMVVACGALWLAGGLTDFPFNAKAFFGSLFIGLGLAFAVSAACFKSPGYLYFLGVFGVVGSMLLMDNYSALEELKFRRTWMMLIAAPGVGSLFLFFVRKFSAAHLKIALLFIGVAALLYLGVSKFVPWSIMIPAIVVLFGLIMLTNVIFRRGKSWDMADNEQDGYLPYPDRNDDEIEDKHSDEK